jgi:hypothetical protein
MRSPVLRFFLLNLQATETYRLMLVRMAWPQRQEVGGRLSSRSRARSLVKRWAMRVRTLPSVLKRCFLTAVYSNLRCRSNHRFQHCQRDLLVSHACSLFNGQYSFLSFALLFSGRDYAEWESGVGINVRIIGTRRWAALTMDDDDPPPYVMGDRSVYCVLLPRIHSFRILFRSIRFLSYVRVSFRGK